MLYYASRTRKICNVVNNNISDEAQFSHLHNTTLQVFQPIAYRLNALDRILVKNATTGRLETHLLAHVLVGLEHLDL